MTNWASERLLVVAGSATLAVAFWLFDSVTLAGVYGAVVLLAVGNGIMWPTVLSLLSKAAGSASQGAVQGLAGSLGAVASIAGLVLGGVLFASVGSHVFWASAATSVIVGLIHLLQSPKP